MREHVSNFQEAGANLAAVGLGGVDYARKFREESGIQFPLLVDEHRLAYRAAGLGKGHLLHIFRADNSKARAGARAAGYKQHRTGRNPFQLGGSFVLGPGNVDVLLHVNRTFSDDAPPEELLAAVRRAGGRP